MLSAILAGIGILLLLVIALLAIPVSFTFQISWQKALRGHIHLQWAFGVVRARIPLNSSKTPSGKAEKTSRKSERRHKRGARNSNPLVLIRQKAFRHRVFRFIADFWRAIHKQNVSLSVRAGLGDPADTGRLWALVGPVAGMLANTRETSISIEPQFMESVFELDSSGSIRFVPLQLFYLVMALSLSPPFWQGIRQMHQAEQ